MLLIKNIDAWNSAFENKEDILLFNFTASWCGPCKKLKPELIKLSQDKKYSNVFFYRVDIDECDEIANKLKITSVPTTLIVKNDNIIARISGANLLEITQNLDKLI
jgi:thioredoxin 1